MIIFNQDRFCMSGVGFNVYSIDCFFARRDVSGVELLMNNHQSLKAEIDAREDNFSTCLRLGKELLSRNHYASNEVSVGPVVLF